jgi:hypothetical protein
MSNPPNNPNPGQPTRIQLTILQRLLKLKPVAIGLLIIVAGSNIVETINNIVQLPESLCRAYPSWPWCFSGKISSQWIGTKIEDVYIKKLKDYEPETTLVVTDKPDNAPENEDISVLRNVDQDISSIFGGKKQNSGQYEAILRKAKNKGIPLCLQIYGKRKFATSEFKNIILIGDFPDTETYDSSNPKKMDQKCEGKHQKFPAPSNSETNN